METSSFLTGQFLLAMPGIGDPRFQQAVIAVCAHDAKGALGIGIGAQIAGLGLHDVLKQVDIYSAAPFRLRDVTIMTKSRAEAGSPDPP